MRAFRVAVSVARSSVTVLRLKTTVFSSRDRVATMDISHAEAPARTDGWRSSQSPVQMMRSPVEKDGFDRYGENESQAARVRRPAETKMRWKRGGNARTKYNQMDHFIDTDRLQFAGTV